MCDFSLQAVASRSANVADKLVTKDFGHGTRGFASIDDPKTAICLLPGTELAFDEPVKIIGLLFNKEVEHKVARFRQINKDQKLTHHDAIEFPDGQIVLLTQLVIGQVAIVLQLPATPKTEAEAEDQRRVEYTG